MIYSKKTEAFLCLLSFIILLFNTELSTAQSIHSKGIELIPVEHASLLLKTTDVNVAIDPVGNHQVYENTFDLILITDIHGDHFNQETLEKVTSSTTTIIAPKTVYYKMNENLQAHTRILNNGDSINSNELIIEATPMYNLREKALNFHTKGRGNGYVLTINGQRIYISGDTEDIPEMRALKNIDIALVCMNLPYTMTENSAADAVMEFQPKVVIPYHFRGRPKVSDINLFESLITNSSIDVVRLDWYPNEDY